MIKSWWHGAINDNKSAYCIQFDYDAEKVEALKTSIPHLAREWNPDTKVWTIAKEYELEIDRLFPGFLEAVISQMRMF